MSNHYKYLDKHLNKFWITVFGKDLNNTGCAGIIVAHGDKIGQYARRWEEAGVPLNHGAMLYLLTYTPLLGMPKWQSCEWVILNYPKYKVIIEQIEKEGDEDEQ